MIKIQNQSDFYSKTSHLPTWELNDDQKNPAHLLVLLKLNFSFLMPILTRFLGLKFHLIKSLHLVLQNLFLNFHSFYFQLTDKIYFDSNHFDSLTHFYLYLTIKFPADHSISFKLTNSYLWAASFLLSRLSEYFQNFFCYLI